MTFEEFRKRIVADLHGAPDGLTWSELKQRNHLPYTRPCPEWIKALEQDDGLIRERRKERALLWEIKPKA
ncbi:hypothetical protein [Coraliomargarita akajimensis]|uniref:Uncharacterized protein n=1 Tax=Coraliomargarita akajimensis (strain DSM 45221 / IAM 15411 / JCM 23193 / KCTC 12865 / 04OKA010-24) TaxID=583355 RepID=D5ER52_CORAD|nr:hypothetical protein [Coraliomargarita akajimensis]ADE55896.1 hypothetical protein Caka_2883 [Coraliomargarita akajimensis DSM 45221]